MIRIDALLRTTFVAFSCDNDTVVERNDHYILSSPVAAEVDAHDFGKQCLLAGQYTVNLEIPYQNAQRSAAGARRRRADPDPEIFVDSVSWTFCTVVLSSSFSGIVISCSCVPMHRECTMYV